MVAIITAVVLFLCVPVGAVIYTILTFDIKRNWKKIIQKRCIFLKMMHFLKKCIAKIFSVLIFKINFLQAQYFFIMSKKDLTDSVRRLSIFASDLEFNSCIRRSSCLNLFNSNVCMRKKNSYFGGTVPI